MFHPKYGCNMMHGLEGEIGYQSGSKVRILTTCHQIMYLLRCLISSVGGSCRHRPGTVFLKPTVGSLIAKQSEQQTSSYFKQPSQPPRPSSSSRCLPRLALALPSHWEPWATRRHRLWSGLRYGNLEAMTSLPVYPDVNCAIIWKQNIQSKTLILLFLECFQWQRSDPRYRHKE